jgi:mono/diheme cytochrome c family protein
MARLVRRTAMRPIRHVFISLVLIFSGACATLTTARQQGSSKTTQNQIDPGRYLGEEVAKCPECHTPRDANFQLDRSRWLQGASIWIEPVHPVVNWAEFAPPLASLPSFTDEQMQQVLEMGQGTNGMPIQPPMHVYHLAHSDAQAIIAYLRSLRPPR